MVRTFESEELVKKIAAGGLLLSVLLVAGLSAGGAKPGAASAANDQVAVLVGAGDIANCTDLSGAEATAKLLEKIPGTVMAVGDLAYPDGSKENFECYDKTWGRVKSRTRPAGGNHEFHSSGATPYFDYFRGAACQQRGAQRGWIWRIETDAAGRRLRLAIYPRGGEDVYRFRKRYLPL